MTHDELLAKIDKNEQNMCYSVAYNGDECKPLHKDYKALRAVVELHKPMEIFTELCRHCCEGDGSIPYPCPTIQAIEKELV